MPGEAGSEVTAQLATQETSSLSSPQVSQLTSDVTGQDAPQPTTVGDPLKESTVKPEPSSPYPNTLFQDSPTALGSTSQSYLSKASTKSQTEVKSTVGASPTVATVDQTGKPTTIPGASPTIWTSIQSQTAGNTTASQSTSNGVIQPTTRPQSTNLTAPTTTSSKLAEKSTSRQRSTTTGAILGGGAVYSTMSHKATKPRQQIIDRGHPRPNPGGKQSGYDANHSRIVAGLIGGALLVMIVGFLVIYVKKRKLRRQQTSTSDWAGPSPFIDGGVDSDQVTVRSLNRISLSGFLPQRLSKRLSLLPEADEELTSITPGNTFGDNREKVSSQKVEDDVVQESNTTSVADLGSESVAGDATKTEENSTSKSE